MVLLWFGCTTHDDPEYELGWVSERLRAAGYQVSAPRPDAATLDVPAVVRSECVDATREGLVDELCVLRCRDRSACRPTLTRRGPLGESYGEFHRGATVLVHRRCAVHSPGRFDCVPARRAIGLLP
jgi:hypothetical protein